MPAPKPSTSNEVIIERVDLILKTLDALVQKMDDAERERAGFRESYAKEHAILDAKATAAHDRITAHVLAEAPWLKKVDDTEKDVIELRHTNRIIIWAAGIIVGSVMLWLLGRFLGLL